VAIFLAYESNSFLVGQTANQKNADGIRKEVLKYPAVEQMRRLLTMHFGPNLVKFGCAVNAELRASELVKVIDELELRIHKNYPDVKRIFIEVEGLKGSTLD